MFSRLKHLLNWLFKNPMSVEPIIIITKTVDFVRLPSDFADKVSSGFEGHKFLIRLEFAVGSDRHVGALFLHVGPFGEALSPGLVILWNGMKLRQIESHQFNRSAVGRSIVSLCHISDGVFVAPRDLSLPRG